MKVKNQRILSFALGVTVGLLLLLKCNSKPIKPDTKIDTQIVHTRDTIFVPRYITIKEDQSIVKRDETNTYDGSKHTNTYYNQIFTDSNYNLTTYGGFVDSIDLIIKTNDVYIYDSTIITNTITNNRYTMYKNTIGVEYLWNGNNSVLLDYTRNFNRIGIGVKAGMNIDTKQPLLGIGVKYHFGKR